MINIHIEPTLYPVLISLVLISVIISWVAIKLKGERNFLPVAIIIPLLLLCSWTIFATFSNLLGYPVRMPIPKDAIYIHHVEEQEREQILVWAYKQGDYGPRVYIIPKTDNNEKAMDQAKGKTQQGIPQLIGKVEGSGAKRSGDTPDGDYLVYDFTVGNSSLKDYKRSEAVPPQFLESDSPG